MENENVIIILMMEKQQAGFIKTSKIGGSLFCAHCSVYGSSFFFFNNDANHKITSSASTILVSNV